jgi:hypothetical protein
MERRIFLKTAGATSLAVVAAKWMTGCGSPSAKKQETAFGKPEVFMTEAITPESRKLLR